MSQNENPVSSARLGQPDSVDRESAQQYVY